MFPRLIPLVLVENLRAVHTVRFGAGKYLGDPLNMSRLFSEFGADELVILDRSRSRGTTILEAGGLDRISREVSVPVSFGGGLRTESDIARAFKAGADKVVLRSDRPRSRRLVSWACSEFGSQAVAVCINFNPQSRSVRKKFVRTGAQVVEHAMQFAALGAGEILVQSVLRAGTKSGLETESMAEVRRSVRCPVVLSGGASSPQDITNAFREGFSGVAISTLFSLDEKSSAPLVSYFSERQRREFGWL